MTDGQSPFSDTATFTANEILDMAAALLDAAVEARRRELPLLAFGLEGIQALLVSRLDEGRA